MRANWMILASAGWLLSGCATSTMLPEPPPVSPTALAPCPPIKALPSGSHSDVERWAVDLAFRYRECSERQALAAKMLTEPGKVEAK